MLWSRRIRNDHEEIEALTARVAGVESVAWAIDMTAPESALLRGVPGSRGQQVRYVPGRVVHSMTGAFAGEGKADARDAVVIAQTARLRSDLTGEATTAVLIQQAASSMIALTRQITDLDKQIADVFRGHRRRPRCCFTL